MHHILGVILRDNDIEIMDDERPDKGSYMGLHVLMLEGRKRMEQNPNIKQINIYRIIQGQRILTQQLFSELRFGEADLDDERISQNIQTSLLGA